MTTKKPQPNMKTSATATITYDMADIKDRGRPPSTRRSSLPEVFASLKVDVTPGVSIRLYGQRWADEPSNAFDVTFMVGGKAIYGSFNLIYTGAVVKITSKTVVVEERVDSFHTKKHHMSLYNFVTKNWHFDLNDIERHNTSVGRSI